MELVRKLAILADAAKYDASCAQRRRPRANRPRGRRHRLDHRHGHLPQLHARRALHLAAQDPAHQLLRLRLPVLRQPALERRAAGALHRRRGGQRSRSTSTGATTSRGCSSARASSAARPTTRWSSWCEVARTLREEHDFRGYIHLKTIPDAEPGADRAGRALRRPAVASTSSCRRRAASRALAPEKDGARSIKLGDGPQSASSARRRRPEREAPPRSRRPARARR